MAFIQHHPPAIGQVSRFFGVVANVILAAMSQQGMALRINLGTSSAIADLARDPSTDDFQGTALRKTNKKTSSGGSDLVQVPLTDDLKGLLKGGQLYSGLILATRYEHGVGAAGSKLKIGETANVRIPTVTSGRAAEKDLQPVLLNRFGNKSALASVWKGDASDKTIYVAFSPARGGSVLLPSINRHILRIYRGSAKVSSPVDKINMSGYLKRKFEALWSDGSSLGLQAFLASLTRSPEYAGYRILFCGHSHGGALAQIAAYRFSRDFSWPNFYAVSWNSYLWTDAQGANRIHEQLGDRLLNFVSTSNGGKSGERYWDPISGYDFGQDFVPMVHTWLLETDCSRKRTEGYEDMCGNFLVCDSDQNCPGQTTLGPQFISHVKIHYASFAIKGMKGAMYNALSLE